VLYRMEISMVPTYRVCRTSRCDVIKRRAPVYGYGSLVAEILSLNNNFEIREFEIYPLLPPQVPHPLRYKSRHERERDDTSVLL
jgi:hypothetical protein